MPNEFVPFDPDFPEVLNFLIIEYLSCSELLSYIYSASVTKKFKKLSCKVLKKHPDFIDFENESSKGNFSVLLNNLLNRVFPAVGFCQKSLHDVSDHKTKYQILCAINLRRIGFVIETDFYSFELNTEIDLHLIHDCVFHYCHTSPVAAGKLLNKNIWKFWKSYLAELLIDKGANVNCEDSETGYTTLFKAVIWGLPPAVIENLIQHQANYDGYTEDRAGAKFTLMLIAALHRDPGIMSVLIEYFPQEVAVTLNTLDFMLKNFSDNTFSCEFKEFSVSKNNVPITHYTYSDIMLAKQFMQQYDLQAYPGTFFRTSSHSLSVQENQHADAKITFRS